MYAKEVLQNEGKEPVGLLRVVAVSAFVGVVSALPYFWWAEWQRQDDLAWE